MEIWFKKLIANISFLMMRVLDGFFDLFKVYSGLEPVSIENGETESIDLLTFFTSNKVVLTIFFSIMLISVGILFFFTVAGIIKTMVNTKRTVGKVVAEFGGAVVSFVLVWALFFGIVFVGNFFLVEIDKAFTDGNNMKMSQRIINIAVSDDAWYKDKETGLKYSAEDFKYQTADELFGQYKKNFGLEQSPEYDTDIDEDTGEEHINYKKRKNTYQGGGMADLFQTNLFLLFITPLVMFILIFITLITLAKRIFEVVFLYLSMPLSVSTIPLDDGAKFKVWKDTMFSKVFSVYGTVIALNLYLILLGLLEKINVGGGWKQTLFDFIFIIGGALAASGGAALFGQLIGATPDAGKNLGQTLYTGMMMGQAAHGVAHGLTTTLVGRKGGMGAGGGAGGRSGGLIQGLGKALNIGGKILGGNKFDNFSKSASSGYQNLKNTLKGSYMNNNGLLGLGQKAAGAATWGLMGKKNREFFNTLSGKGGDKK